MLLALILLAVGAGLLVQAPGKLWGSELYVARPAGADGGVPPSIAAGGPGITGGPTGLRSLPVAPRTIAPTFDDGPDPVWTDEILAVLSRHGVHATFFVLGDRALRNPEVLRRIQEQGSEIGSHGFSHADLASLSPWQSRLELRATQLVIQGITGQSTALLRPPFSSTAAALDDPAFAEIRRTAAGGYLTVLATRDGRDWAGPGVNEIVANLTPAGPGGEVLLLHDGGGDRAQTVAALDRLIPDLQRRGYRFTTAGEALGAAGTTAPAPPLDWLLGLVLVWGMAASQALVATITWAMVIGGVIAVVRAVALHVSSRRHHALVGDGGAPTVVEPVTVIVPAHNEAAGIEAAVRSLVASTHPVQVIVVDDGSTDDTAELVAALGLPGVRVLRQRNGGKSVALNTGLAAADTELVVMVDGDTVVEPGTITALVQPFADARVGAVSGNAKVANRGGLLGRWQHIEYVIGFNMDRRWYDLARCMPTVPGAVGGFRRDAILQVGGVSSETLAEDTDLTMALGRAGWRLVYEPQARAWTEAPASLAALWRQRYRWCYGTLQSMWKHRGGLRRPGNEGRYTRRSLGYMTVFQVVLPLLAPAVDVFAVYGLLLGDPVRTVAIWLAFQALDLVIALTAFRLERESPRVLWALPLTQFCYRQLMYAVVIQSIATAVAGTRLRWHRMDRYGTFASSGTAGRTAQASTRSVAREAST